MDRTPRPVSLAAALAEDARARDDRDGEYLKRNRWFESGSLQRGVAQTRLS
jgi:hypothetical protein